jgi:hypothetical protein
MRQELNSLFNIHTKKSPYINDDYYGDVILKIEGGKVKTVKLNETFKMKPQHEIDTREVLKKLG